MASAASQVTSTCIPQRPPQMAKDRPNAHFDSVVCTVKILQASLPTQWYARLHLAANLTPCNSIQDIKLCHRAPLECQATESSLCGGRVTPQQAKGRLCCYPEAKQQTRRCAVEESHLGKPKGAYVAILKPAQAGQEPLTRGSTAGEGLDQGNAAEAAGQQAQLAGCEGCQAVWQPQKEDSACSVHTRAEGMHNAITKAKSMTHRPEWL